MNPRSIYLCFSKTIGCLTTTLLLLLSMNTSAAAGGENLVFILDASGSMWGQVEGRHKIVIAKEVMTDLIQELPAGLKIGLVTYGHRRKGDCNDVEELAPLGPLDRKRLIETIKAIEPKGKTPITHSIQITAERLKALEEETTIVLVSDGKETCEGDPCALVRELRKTGIKIVMHVIGFDVTDAERGQLQCIADAGGGTYFTADTAKEFSIAAKKIVDKPKYKGSYLKIVAIKNGKSFGATVDIFPAGEDEYIAYGLTPQEFKLLPGTYDIRVKDRGVPGEPTKWIRGVKVESGKKMERTAEFTGGRLEIAALKNGKPFNATVDVFPAGEDEYIAHGLTPQEFKLLPGTYDIRVKDRGVPGEPTKWIRGVEVESGKKIERTAEFTGGRLEVAALKNGKPFNASVDVFPTGEDEYIAYGLTPQEFKLLPGTYDIRVKDRGVPGEPTKWIRGVEVEPGKKIKRSADFADGQMMVIALMNGQSVSVEVDVFPAGEEKYIAYGRTPKGFRLLPGIYDVRVKDRSVPQEPVVWVRGVEVKAGGKVKVEAKF